MVLDNKSKLVDISNYINSFPAPPFNSNVLNELLSNLANLGIDSYSFTFGANTASRTISKEIIPLLEDYLRSYSLKEDGYNVEFAFTAYYLLAYYNREYEKLSQMERMINSYDSLFPEYALKYQIRGRLKRRKGEGREALNCDLTAMAILEKENISNLGVSITYASTVSIALENGDDFIQSEDIQRSIQATNDAISLNPMYAKYYYLKSRLIMFSLHLDIDKHSYNYFSQQILEAKELLRKAIEYENEKADAYLNHVIEYKSYMRQADLVLAEIRIILRMNQQSTKASEEIDSRFERTQAEVEKNFSKMQKDVAEKLQDTQNRFLELLALFVSVVSIIMVVIGMFSSEFTFLQVLVTIVSMNVSVVAVYSVFLILLRQKILLRYCVSLFICTGLIIVLIMFALMGDSDIWIIDQFISGIAKGG